jgi:hypothetical protein
MAQHLINMYNNIYDYLPFQLVPNHNNNHHEQRQENYFYLPDGRIVKESRITINENGRRRVIHDRQLGHRTYREVITHGDDDNDQMIVRYTRGFNPNIEDINIFIGEFQNYMNNNENINNWNQVNHQH